MPLARPALLPWLSRDWHTPSLGWLVFCLFCIQNVACGLCFLLDFSHPVGPPLDVITQTFYAFRALRWEESQTWFLKSMERQFGRSGEGTGLHLAWRSRFICSFGMDLLILLVAWALGLTDSRSALAPSSQLTRWWRPQTIQ